MVSEVGSLSTIPSPEPSLANSETPDSGQPPLSSSADHPASTDPGTRPSPLMAQASTQQLPESFDAVRAGGKPHRETNGAQRLNTPRRVRDPLRAATSPTPRPNGPRRVRDCIRAATSPADGRSTAMPESTDLSTLSSNPIIMSSRHILKGPDVRPLDVVGSFKTTLSLRSASDRSLSHTVYVVRGLQTPLLGLPAITALKMFSTDTLSRVPVSASSSSDTELQAEVDASAVSTSSSFVIETDSLPAAVERLPKIAAARAHDQRGDLSSSDAPIALQQKQPTSSPPKQQSTPAAKKEWETKSTSRNTTSGGTSSRARPNG